MQSVYSVYGSKLHLILPDDFAEAYNRAHEKFMKANPVSVDLSKSTVLVSVDMTQEERDAFNKFAALLNHLIEVNGGAMAYMTEKDCLSDFLVKVEGD